jgi:hypothetical protein
MNTPDIVFRSRFGFHPCDTATYRKLKQLKKWYWETVRDFHRWWRWWRKEPQNRRGDEPQFCPCFVLDKPWVRPRLCHGEAAVRYYPKTLTDCGILTWHAAARTPQSQPPPIFTKEFLAEIEKLHAAVTAWHAEE